MLLPEKKYSERLHIASHAPRAAPAIGCIKLLKVRGESVLQHCNMKGWPYKDTLPLLGSFMYLQHGTVNVPARD
jgi:hypothetical protein